MNTLDQITREAIANLPVPATPSYPFVFAEEPYVRLAIIYNPFDLNETTKHELVWDDKKTLADYMVGLPEDIIWRVAVDGIVMDPDFWADTVPSAFSNIALVRIPEGGGGDKGKSVLRIVAMIAVLAFAAWAAPWIVAVMGAAGMGATAMGVTMMAMVPGVLVSVGGMIVNAVLPPVQPGANQKAESATYGIDGAKNTSQEGVVLPIGYGEYRVAGNISDFHTKNVGKDQYFFMRTVLNDGEIASIEDIEINDLPLSDFSDVQVRKHYGTADQEPNDWFAEATRMVSAGVHISQTFQERLTNSEVDRMRVDVVFPSGLVSIDQDDGVTKDPQTVTLQLEYVPTDNLGNIDAGASWAAMPIGTRVDTTGSSVYYTTPADVTSHTVSVNTGASGIANDTSYAVTGYYRPVGASTWIAAPVVTGNAVKTTSTNLTVVHAGNGLTTDTYPTIEYEFQFPTPGQYETKVIGAGSSHAGAFGSTTTAASLVVRDKTTKAIRLSYESSVLPRGYYKVRIRRTTPQSTVRGQTVEYVYDECWMSDLVEIDNVAVAMNGIATLSIRGKVNDQINGTPKVTARCKLSLVNIYDEEGAVVSNVWSDNPADIAFDILHNTRRGAGFPLNKTLWSRYVEAREYCESAGLKFNGVFDTSSNLWDSVQSVARVGHATIVNRGTKFNIVVDRPEAPVAVFTPANMFADTFQKTWMGAQDLANEVQLEYQDGDDSFKNKTIRIPNEAAFARGDRQKIAQVSGFGITSTDQAIAEAEYHVRNNQYIRSFISFDAPLEAIGLSIGDVALIQHDATDFNNGVGGRLAAGSTTSVINLDRPLPMEVGKNYSLLIVQDAVQRYAGVISSISGNRVSVTGLPDVAVDALPAISRLRQGANDFEVLSISKISSTVFRFTVEDASSLTAAPLTLWDTDVIEERDVVYAAGDPSTVAVTAPFTLAASQFANFLFGEKLTVKLPYRLRSVSGDDIERRKLGFAQYDARVYEPGSWGTSAITSVPRATLGHVRHLYADYDRTALATQERVAVTLTWQAPENTNGYGGADIYLKVGDSWTITTTVNSGSQFTRDFSRTEELLFKVVAFDIRGNRARFSDAPETTTKISVVTEVLAAPTALAYTVPYYRTDATANVSWTAPVGAASDTFYRVDYKALSGGDYTAFVAAAGVPASFPGSVTLDAGYETATTNTDVSTDVPRLDISGYSIRVRAERGFTVSPWAYLPVSIVAPALPATPTNLKLNAAAGTTFSTSDAQFSWDDIITTLAGASGITDKVGAAFTWKDYEVKVLTTAGALLRTEYTRSPNYNYTLEKNAQDTLGVSATFARRTFKIEVRLRGQQGQISSPISLTVSNAAAAATSITAVPNLGGFTVKSTGTLDPDVTGIVVWASVTSGFTTGAPTLVYKGTLPAVVTGLTNGTVYFYKYAFYDVFDDGSLTASSQSSLTTPLVAAVDLTPALAIDVAAAAAAATAAAASASAAAASSTTATTQATTATTQAAAAVTSANTASTQATNASTSATNSLASQNAAATSATNAGTSASTASTQAAAALTQATAAATSAGTATTQATNASTSAGTATTQATAATTQAAAALTQATAAAASAGTATTQASAASGSATTASTQATNAATQATAAAASAGTASTQATNASTSAGTAATQATTATTQATNAATSATTASTQATAASTSATAALASQNAAAISASGAGTSATTASTQAAAALTSANNSATSATNAATSATNSGNSATAAAGSATTATNQASAATGSASAASGSATAAQSTLNVLIPDRPARKEDFYEGYQNTYATPEAIPLMATGTVQTVANEGQVLERANNGGLITTRGWLPVGTGQTFTVDTRAALIVDGATGNGDYRDGFLAYSSAGVFLGPVNLTVRDTSWTVGDGWRSFAATSTSTQILAAWPTAAYVRGAFGGDNIGSGTYQVARVSLRNTTDAAAAAGSATAASTSATAAGTSATNAGTSASAAATSATNAATSATGAAGSASAAGTSATAASGSASTATTQAANAATSASAAATSATNAGNSATAASTSASTASTQATNAGNSATAAASSATAASSSYTNTVLVDGNQDFSDGLTGWTVSNGVGSTVQSSLGSRANVLTNTTGGFRADVFTVKKFPFDPARKYKIRGWYYTGAGTGPSQVYIGFRAYNSAGATLTHNPGSYAYVAASGVNQAANAGWVEYVSPVIVPEVTGSSFGYPVGTASINLLALGNYNASTTAWGLDNISLIDVTEAEAAATSATAAATSASNASTSATAAGTSATAASTSATSAATQATNSANSASAAGTSATNASNSASTATTQAANASTSAGAAATSATNSANSATAASTSATTAATQATNSGNSATAAAASATNAASSFTAANNVAVALLPETIDATASFFGYGATGASGVNTAVTLGHIQAYNGGFRVIRPDFDLFVLTRGLVPAVAGRVYEVDADYQMPVGSSGSIGAAVYGLDTAFASVGTVGSTTVGLTSGLSATTSLRFSNVASAGIIAWPAGSVWLRFAARTNGISTGESSAISRVRVRDVTEQVASEVQAAAAATSASNASTSATAAGTSATAASTSATNAATSATGAAGSASAAGTSATNASGSASTATTQAANAATSATAAATSATNSANSATAASTSASTASTQATNAGNSATAASTSATNASSSYEGSRSAVAVTAPSDFVSDGIHWTTSTQGLTSLPNLPTTGVTYPTVSGIGKVLQFNGAVSGTQTNLSPRTRLQLVAGRSHKLTIKRRATVDDTGFFGGAVHQDWFGFAALDVNGISLGNMYLAGTSAETAAEGWTERTATKTTAEILAVFPTAVFISWFTILNLVEWYNPGYNGATGNSTIQVAFLRYEDVTDQVAAAASATAAATSASAAGTSATNAGTSATAASTSATNAATSATGAAGSASAAGTSATNASGSASTATTQAANASTSAGAAATSATNSSNSATAAAGSATTAATQATNSGNSATSAAASSTSAASSFTATNLLTASLFPDRYDGTGQYFSALVAGTPASMPDLASNATASGYGPVRAASLSAPSNYADFATRGVLAAIPGRVYKIEIEFQQTSVSGTPDAATSVSLQMRPLDSAHASPGFDGGSPGSTFTGGVQTLSYMFSNTASSGVAAWRAGTIWVRPFARINSGAATALTVEVRRMTVTDITEQQAAAGSATAAATSASNASTSATAAGTSATAASTSATNAATQATNAAGSASAASTSATNASGSASTATTQAANASTSAGAAATSATNSSNSATAAAGSATTASTQATNAGNSATSAAASSVSATSAYTTGVIYDGNMEFDAGRTGWALTSANATNGIEASPGSWTTNASYNGKTNVLTTTVNTQTNLYSIRKYTINPSRKYRVNCRFHIGAGTGANVRMYFGLQQFDATGATVGSNQGFRYISVGGLTYAPGTGWVEVTGAVVTGSGTGSFQFETTCAYIRLIAFANYDANATVTTAVDEISFLDVTEVEAAATSATAAATSATAAGTSATNAGTSATAASTSATNAATQATNAAGSASAASTSATNASGSASTATTQAANASTSAGAAATSATNAGNSATAASGSASTASTQATNAGNSATAAAASSVSASSNAANAQLIAANLFPATLDSTASQFTLDTAGSPASVAVPLIAGVVNRAGFGFVYTLGANPNFHSRGVEDATNGRIYEVEAEVEVFAYGSQQVTPRVGLRALDGSYASLGTVEGQWTNFFAAPGIATFKYRFSDTAPSGGAAWTAGAVWLRPYVRFSGGTGATVYFRKLTVTDVTALAASEAQATAAAGSATAASTSATAAGTSATAASTSATNAATSATGAAGSASAASTSATAASGSASTATTQAANASTSAGAAATSATNSSNSATAAAGSATTAGTSATNAGNSATSAAASAVTAQSTLNVLIPDRPARKEDVYSAFTTTYATPEAIPLFTTGTVVSVANEGSVLEIASTSLAVTTRGWLPVSSGRTFTCEARMALTVDGATGTADSTAGFFAYTAAGVYLGSVSWGTQDTTWTVAEGWRTFTVTTTSTAILAAWPTAAYVRASGGINAGTGCTFQISRLSLRDTTDAAAAAASATAASTSASAASTSATAAGTSATAANTSATNASTSAGTASTQATNASNSATTAAGSATAAGTSATAASGSATTAATQATNASGSASAAGTSATNAAGSASTATTQAANASTSATAAATSATNSANSATAANTSAGTAATSATNAGTSATAASGSATTASTQATNAAGSATAASGSAAAAGTSATNAAASASTATTQASNAATSATTAATSATNSGNSATAAATSATGAATSATNAGNSATSASGSATNAASSFTAANAVAINSVPSDFSSNGQYWFNGFTGSPTTRTPISAGGIWSFPTVAGTGTVIQAAVTGSTDVGMMGAIKAISGRRYRITSYVRVLTALTGTPSWGVTARGLDTSYAHVPAASVSNGYNLPAANNWYGIVLEIDGTSFTNNGGVFLRPSVNFGTAGNTYQCQFVLLEDITDSYAASTSATAAATSASNASTSATAAGTSATSASTSATNAATSATGASGSASAASTSATSASGSASTATTQAANASTSAGAAATSATNAANSATAANTSAATASTQATNAGTSATAANTSATNAASSFTSASTQATNAAGSATAAGTSATAAQSALNVLIPDRPSRKADFYEAYTTTYATPDAIPVMTTGTVTTNGAEGSVLQHNAVTSFVTRGWLPVSTTRTFSFDCRAAMITDTASGLGDWNMAFAAYTAAGVYLGLVGNTAQDATWTVGEGWRTFTLTTTSSAITTAFATAAYVRAVFSAIGTSTSTYQVSTVWLRDTTAATAAAGSATAAASSASAASTSATNAGTSATNAGTSATTATTQAGTSTTQAGNAASSATAAGTSATNAATSATGAAGSATSATASANTATTQAGNASTSASAASTSAAASSTSAASASTSATVAASAGVRALIKNPNFNDYPTTPGIPTGWNAQTSNASGTRVTGETGLYAYQLTGGASADGYAAIDGIAGGIVQNAWFVIEANVKLDSGAFTASGVLFSGLNTGGAGVQDLSLKFAIDPDSTGAVIGAGTVGKVYRFAKLVRITNATADKARVFAISHWSGFGSTAAANQITWYSCLVRPATDQEIASQAATAGLVATNATVTTLSTATTTLQQVYSTYGVQVNANGNIAGIYLYAAGGITNTSGFKIEANQFQIRSTTATAVTPFTYDAVAGKLSLNSVAANEIEATATIKIGIGDNTVILDGKSTSDKRIAVGNSIADSAPFWVSKTGKMKATDWELYDANGALMLSKNGPTDAFKLSILAAASNSLPTTSAILGSVVNIPSTTTVLAQNKLSARLGDNSTVSIGVSWNLAAAYAANNAAFPSTVTLAVHQRYSADNVTWGAWSSMGSQVFTKITSGSPTSAQFRVKETTTTYSEYEQGISYVTYAETSSVVDAGNPASFTVTATSKNAGYYEYAVVGGDAAPFLGCATVLTVTDTDGVPSFILNNTASTGSVAYTNPVGTFKRLKIATTSTTAGTVTADFVIVSTPEGLTRTISNLNTTFSTGSTGLGALDTGTLTQSVWYYIWAVSNGSVDGVVLSLSNTSPSLTGYRYKALIGVTRSNLSTQLLPFKQSNARVRYVFSTNTPYVIASSTSGNTTVANAMTAFDITALFPTAVSAEVQVSMQLTNNSAMAGPNNTFGALTSTTAMPPIMAQSSGNYEHTIFLESDYIYYASNSGNAKLVARGFVMDI